MAPTMEEEDARHRREQSELRAKRKAHSSSKSDSTRERKRREHTQRILEEKRREQKGIDKKSKTSSSKGGGGGEETTSEFQSLFSKRAEGFLVDLNFRNAPPRPPVGPTFVGHGLEGELENQWTEYRPGNAVERNHTWKLHSEADLGVSLGKFAMDLRGCYKVPKRAKLWLQQQGSKNGGRSAIAKMMENENVKEKLHPDDRALLNWKGSLGNTAAEQLKIRREKARAATLLSLAGGTPSKKTADASTTIKIKKQDKDKKGADGKVKFSRVLDEANPFFMKKTTYLSNDQYRSVHQFKSLANTKKETADLVEKKIKEQKEKMMDPKSIEYSFEVANTETRKHPTKKNVTMVYDLPLLPDVPTWGHTFTHVILDNPPKPLANRPAPTSAQLSKAFIADVEMKTDTTKMECNLLVPKNNEQQQQDDDSEHNFDVAQQYDLDVFPLKEEDSPHVNFLLVVDEKKGVVTYHPVSSRVQLSTGRPGQRCKNTIVKRELSKEEVEDIDTRAAEVDLDLAEKYNLE